MSVVVRGIQIFSGLSTFATIPFASSFLGERVQLPRERTRPIPKAPIEIPEKVEKREDAIIVQAIETITKTKGGIGLGCVWAPGFRKLEFLFCFDTGEKETSPFWFHYSWGSNKNVEERLKLISEIPDSKMVKFQDAGSESISTILRAQLFWVSKFKPEVFAPSKHCKVTHVSEKEDYKLTCYTPSNNTIAWTKDIPKGQVVKPTIKLQQEN